MMAPQSADQQDEVLDGTRDRHEHAPHPPRSTSWRLELIVAVLGLIIGLTAALAFLG
jgi:hypothetical protein